MIEGGENDQASPNQDAAPPAIRPVQIRLSSPSPRPPSLQSLTFYPQPQPALAELHQSLTSSSVIASSSIPSTASQPMYPQLSRPVHTVLASFPVGGPPSNPATVALPSYHNPHPHSYPHQHHMVSSSSKSPSPPLMSQSSQRSRPPAKRKQVKNACVNCQRACKKCDDARPCTRCVKYGMEATCVDSARKERRRGMSITGSSPSETNSGGRRTPRQQVGGIVSDEADEDLGDDQQGEFGQEGEAEDGWSQTTESLKLRLPQRRRSTRANSDPSLFKELVNLCADEWEELEQQRAPPPSVLVSQPAADNHFAPVHFEPTEAETEEAGKHKEERAKTPAVHELIPTPPETPTAKAMIESDLQPIALPDPSLHAPLPYTTKAQPGWSKQAAATVATSLTLPFLPATHSSSAVSNSLNFVDLSKAFHHHQQNQNQGQGQGSSSQPTPGQGTQPAN